MEKVEDAQKKKEEKRLLSRNRQDCAGLQAMEENEATAVPPAVANGEFSPVEATVEATADDDNNDDNTEKEKKTASSGACYGAATGADACTSKKEDTYEPTEASPADTEANDSGSNTASAPLWTSSVKRDSVEAKQQPAGRRKAGQGKKHDASSVAAASSAPDSSSTGSTEPDWVLKKQNAGRRRGEAHAMAADRQAEASPKVAEAIRAEDESRNTPSVPLVPPGVDGESQDRSGIPLEEERPLQSSGYPTENARPPRRPGAERVAGPGIPADDLSQDMALNIDDSAVQRSNPLHPSEGDSNNANRRAYSAYVVRLEQQPKREEEGDGPMESANGAVLIPPPAEEPVYNGVPVPPSPGGRTEEMEARERRRRCRILCAGAVLALLAGVIAAAVVTSLRKPAESELAPQENPSTLDPTTMPSLSPSSEKFSSLRSMLTNALTSHHMSADALDDPSTPQGKALHWLAYEDEHEHEHDVLNVQRFALATLYFSTSGPDAWADKYDFLTPQHECDWNVPNDPAHSVHYGQRFESVGVFCEGDNATVTRLVIVQNNLTGVLPKEIGLLESLEWVGIAKNNMLHGQLPAAILNLPRLQLLSLVQNSLSGPIPGYSSTSSPLEYLLLSANNLNSTIPSSLGNLSNLEILAISLNNLTGSIPFELAQLSQLEALFIDSNALTGSVPSELAQLSQLKELGIDNNNISTIPMSLFTLHNLTFLKLNDNYIKGTVPSEIGHLTQLQELYIADNFLEGTLPPALWELTTLEHLHLALNDFTGTLSQGVGNLTELRDLRLYGNELSGAIPTAIELLTNLEHLDLSINQFTGRAPDQSLGRLKTLKYLDLGRTSLTGDLASLCNLSLPLSISDCFVGADASSPEVKCECCTACCLDGIDDGPVYGCFPNN